MRRLISAFLVLAAIVMYQSTALDAKEAGVMTDNITWLGHDTFRIKGAEQTVYTDPFRITGGPKADIILVTHDHYDHCSPEDIAKIHVADTVIVSPSDCEGQLKGDVRKVKPGDRITVKGVVIEVVPAYNIDKKFHPKKNNWVGYVFTLDSVRYYLAGDTDIIPEMKNIECDIAFLPVSGTYTMTAEEAAKAALDIKPKLAIPMHYGTLAGTVDDAKRFIEALKGKIEVQLLPKSE